MYNKYFCELEEFDSVVVVLFLGDESAVTAITIFSKKNAPDICGYNEVKAFLSIL